MMVAAWLGCGLVAALVAWSGRPHGYPSEPATALAAGLCGGFLGGALMILTAGRRGALPAVSIYGASVGAIVMLDLVERISGRIGGSGPNRSMAWLWSWLCLLDPLLLAAAVGITLGAKVHSPPLGLLIGVAAMPLLGWKRDRAMSRSPEVAATLFELRRRHRERDR